MASKPDDKFHLALETAVVASRFYKGHPDRVQVSTDFVDKTGREAMTRKAMLTTTSNAHADDASSTVVDYADATSASSQPFTPLVVIAYPAFTLAHQMTDPDWGGCWVQTDEHLLRLYAAYLAAGVISESTPVSDTTFFGAPVRVATPQQWAKLGTLVALRLAEKVISDVH